MPKQQVVNITGVFVLSLAAVVSILSQNSILTWSIMVDVKNHRAMLSTEIQIPAENRTNVVGQWQTALFSGFQRTLLQEPSRSESDPSVRDRLKLFVEESNNTQFPRVPPPRTNHTNERILVVYSGPTHFVNPRIRIRKYRRYHKMAELYRVNFELFLQHGVQCKTQDTLIVVTEVVADFYRPRVELMNRACQEYGHQVILIVRENKCLDLESVRVALYDGHVDVQSYDYFVYLNCGVTGPSPLWADLPWTDLVLSRLSENVKMTGITLNCKGPKHLQSMLYALDRAGLKLVMDKGAIFDCMERFPDYMNLTETDQHRRIVNAYERHLSHTIMHAGYGISSFLQPNVVLFDHNKSSCRDGKHDLNDVWISQRMVDYFGKIPSLDEIVFFKTSRILAPETAKLLNYTPKIDWNW